jgi:hypothetical protein
MVPIGPSTIAGYSATTIAFSLAVVAYITGDRSEQTLGTLAAAAAGVIALVVTNIGRFLQAKEIVKAEGALLVDDVDAFDPDDPSSVPPDEVEVGR